ncbi:MAG: hypothetical protein ACTHJ7_08310 [Candidatus Nitrosocosmicus sp.]
MLEPYNKNGIHNPNYKHGGKGTRLYNIWKDIKKRCSNPKCINYRFYGGRGIKRCIEWDDFSVFREWAINNGYADSLTIDRINYNGNYEPSNCRWVTMDIQKNNTRSNTFFNIDGEVLTMAQVARKYNISSSKLSARVTRLGWPIEKAILNVDTNRGC